MLDYLEEKGVLDNTVIVYTSDQGFLLGEHGLYDKRFMYEESFRTPLIISCPSLVKKHSVCKELVQNIDLAPTFLSLAGVEVPKEMSGRSLLPLFKMERRKIGEMSYTIIFTIIRQWVVYANMMAFALNATN